MQTTIRSRAAALGIATVAGLAGVGLASGPAVAADSSDETAATASDANSIKYPKTVEGYVDELVRAWGSGDMDRADAFASDAVVKELSRHSENRSHWVRVGGGHSQGADYVVYDNTVTGEEISLGVPREDLLQGDKPGKPNLVQWVVFHD